MQKEIDFFLCMVSWLVLVVLSELTVFIHLPGWEIIFSLKKSFTDREIVPNI